MVTRLLHFCHFYVNNFAPQHTQHYISTNFARVYMSHAAW
ncbi:hypothetical protein Barb4_00634 [Bacteroidales bacterium Barb4]|nr:hypothetical protein Barb4_00634 [Bacteroidales bacterium Barb4]